MGRSHAILNVIIGGGGGGMLQSHTSNPTTIPRQDDAHDPPDLSILGKFWRVENFESIWWDLKILLLHPDSFS